MTAVVGAGFSHPDRAGNSVRVGLSSSLVPWAHGQTASGLAVLVSVVLVSHLGPAEEPRSERSVVGVGVEVVEGVAQRGER